MKLLLGITLMKPQHNQPFTLHSALAVAVCRNKPFAEPFEACLR